MERLEHPHDRLRTRLVGAIGLHAQPHVFPPPPGAVAREGDERPEQEDRAREEPRRGDAVRGPAPDGTRLPGKCRRQGFDRLAPGSRGRRLGRRRGLRRRCRSDRRAAVPERGPGECGTGWRWRRSAGRARHAACRRAHRPTQGCPETAVEQPATEGKGQEDGEQAQDSPEKQAEHLAFLLRPRPANGTAPI